jgi:hypothetical protein
MEFAPCRARKGLRGMSGRVKCFDVLHEGDFQMWEIRGQRQSARLVERLKDHMKCTYV